MKIITNYKLLITNLRKCARSQRGVTIVELLLYMGLLSILIVILVDIFVSILDVQTESESFSSVTQDGRFLTSRLVNDIHNARNILVPATNGSQSATMQMVIGGITYSYAVTNGNLVLTNNFGTDVLNGYNTTVSNLLFKRYGNTNGKPTVQITFTLTGNTLQHKGVEKQDFQITGSTR